MIRFERLGYRSILPTIADNGSCGHDLYSIEGCRIPPKSSAVIRTGITSDFFADEALLIRSRSGLAFDYGVVAFHGTIDSSYKDEIKVLLFNHSDVEYEVSQGDRIAQALLINVKMAPDCEILSEVRTGGFGSSGA